LGVLCQQTGSYRDALWQNTNAPQTAFHSARQLGASHRGTAMQTVPALPFCKRSASKKANRLTPASNIDLLLSASSFAA